MDAETARALAADLAKRLAQTAPLWRPVPFHDDPPWVESTPALAGVLLSLDDERVEQLEARPESLQQLIAAQVPAVASLLDAAVACIDTQPPPAPLNEPESAGRDVPGRKWQQLLHFAAACAADQAPQESNAPHVAPALVEWCSGKAHLGRLLARTHQARVTAIEWNAGLCADGARLAVRESLPIVFRHADVLQINAQEAGLVSADGTPVHALALHACGDLHVALIEKAATAGTALIDIAPCCYHLTRSTHWQPMSAALTDCELSHLLITREELRLAVQETVTSSARVIRQQHEMAAWRLGFDLLQRNLRGVDAYLRTPPRSVRVLAGGFPAFCADLAAHHGQPLPADIDYEHWLLQGRARLARVRRLDLLRHACRRALETLIVADRALFLAEHGYTVRLRRFCPRELTPRNLLIQARRPASPINGRPDMTRP